MCGAYICCGTTQLALLFLSHRILRKIKEKRNQRTGMCGAYICRGTTQLALLFLSGRILRAAALCARKPISCHNASQLNVSNTKVSKHKNTKHKKKILIRSKTMFQKSNNPQQYCVAMHHISMYQIQKFQNIKNTKHKNKD